MNFRPILLITHDDVVIDALELLLCFLLCLDLNLTGGGHILVPQCLFNFLTLELNLRFLIII